MFYNSVNLALVPEQYQGAVALGNTVHFVLSTGVAKWYARKSCDFQEIHRALCKDSLSDGEEIGTRSLLFFPPFLAHKSSFVVQPLRD